MPLSSVMRSGLVTLQLILAQFITCLALSSSTFRIAIVGGGCSGMMAASAIHETLTNDASLSSQCTEGYPRGRKEITSLLTKYFPPMQQQTWFEERGITFTTRQDGVMVTNNFDDSSEIIINALMQDLSNTRIETKSKVSSISKDETTGKFHLQVNGNDEIFDSVILATGNSHLGYQLAKSLGHTISKPARSCFGFRIKENSIFSRLQDGKVYNLPHVRLSYKVSIKGQKRLRIIKSEGCAQLWVDDNQAVTLTGIAALSLSSAAAYELQDASYTGTLLAHFCPDYLGGKVENIEQFLWQYRQDNPNEVVGEKCCLFHYYVDYDEYDWETESFKTITIPCIPNDLWEGLVQDCGIAYGSAWSKLSPKKCRQLAESIVGCSFEFTARSKGFAYPFLTAGGVLLREINMSTMQSKIVDGLFFCGQVLDGDGSHFSFSTMRSLASGRVAGGNAVEYIICQQQNCVKTLASD
eukprot:scaffold63911_cov67-Cyclotella_meneghiniana.AAC.15